MIKSTICFVLVLVASVFADSMNASESNAGLSDHHGFGTGSRSSYLPPRTGGCSPLALAKAHACCTFPMIFSNDTMKYCENKMRSLKDVLKMQERMKLRQGMRGMPGMKQMVDMQQMAAVQQMAAGQQMADDDQMINKPAGNKPKTYRGKREAEVDDMGKTIFCMLKAEGIVVNENELKLDVLTEKFYNAAGDNVEWKKAYDTTLPVCQSKAANAVVAPSVSKLFKPFAKNMMLLTCMRKRLLMSCPSGSIGKAASCATTLSDLKDCDPFQLPQFQNMPPEVQKLGLGKFAGKLNG